MQSGACELIKTLTLFRLGYFGKRYVCVGGGGALNRVRKFDEVIIIM